MTIKGINRVVLVVDLSFNIFIVMHPCLFLPCEGTGQFARNPGGKGRGGKAEERH